MEATAVKSMLNRLIILKETADHLGIEHFHIGGVTRVQDGLLEELAHRQIRRRMETYGQRLHEQYRTNSAKVLQLLQAALPEFAGMMTARSKDATSIADKLTRKAIRTGDTPIQVGTQEAAAQLIRDGIGIRMILSRPSRNNIGKIRDGLVKAIESGRLQVLEIHNLYGSEADALPYFLNEDIEKIRMAQASLPGTASIKLLSGPGRRKSAGYTTTQFDLQLKNQETGNFDLPVCELQVRGMEVHEFSAVEHLVYEIRRGKNIYRNFGIQSCLQPEITPLLEAIEGMDEKEFEEFTAYLSAFYTCCRHLEEGRKKPEPELPEGLPAICHISELKRLSKLRQYLMNFSRRIKEK